MSKKQKIIMLGASSSGFNGVVTGSVVITPTPMSSQTIDITKSFNELDISGPTTLLYSGTPSVDGLRTIVGLQNTTASPVVVTLPGSPQAWSIDHGSVQGSFTIPAYGRVEMLFRWDDTDGIWVVSSMPMTIAQVKAILAILFSDIGGIIGPNQLGSGSALQVVRRNAANDALEFADGGTGSGDVTAASSFGADNRIVRSDGTGKGVQASGAEIDDNGNVNVLGDGVQGSVTLADAHATDPKSISITVPATITNPYRLVLPGVIPTVGQGLRVASVAGEVVTLEHATPAAGSCPDPAGDPTKWWNTGPCWRAWLWTGAQGVGRGGEVSGTGASNSEAAQSTDGVTAIRRYNSLPTGTTTTGRASLALASSTGATYPWLEIMPDRKVFCAFVFRCPASVSDGTDTYTIGAGWFNEAHRFLSQDFAFRYTHSEYSGNWSAYCNDGTSLNASTSKVFTANEVVFLGVEWTGTHMVYWDLRTNTALATIACTLSADEFNGAPQIIILKSAGTNNRTIDVKAMFIAVEHDL